MAAENSNLRNSEKQTLSFFLKITQLSQIKKGNRLTDRLD